MEMYSNNIIKEKIDSVNDLPNGYTPNLANKWELLEAGLVKQKEKKPLLFYIRQTASIAALLLLFGGVGLFLMKQQVQTTPTTKPASSFNATGQMDKQEAGKLQAVKQTIITPVTKKDSQTKPAVAKKNMVVEPEVVVEQPVIAFIDSPKVTQIVAEEQVTAKAKRFTEIDFNEPIISAKTSIENVVASQKFKFKIGFSAQSNSAAVNNNKGSGLGLVKQIN